LRRGLLLRGRGILWLLGGLLLSRLTTSLNLDKVLAYSNSVVLAYEELLDGAGFGCIDSNIDL